MPNESQVSRVARLPKPDNYDRLAAAFRSVSLSEQMREAGKMADKLDPPKEQSLPSDQDFASGGSYL